MENNKIYFELQQLPTIEDVHKAIKEDEGKCCQIISFSSFHDCLTQINFTKRVIRTNLR